MQAASLGSPTAANRPQPALSVSDGASVEIPHEGTECINKASHEVDQALAPGCSITASRGLKSKTAIISMLSLVRWKSDPSPEPTFPAYRRTQRRAGEHRSHPDPRVAVGEHGEEQTLPTGARWRAVGRGRGRGRDCAPRIRPARSATPPARSCNAASGAPRAASKRARCRRRRGTGCPGRTWR